MVTLFREGGFPMWFVLLFGAVSLAAAGRFAYKPTRDKLGFIYGMSGATLLTTLMAICADLAAVGHHANERWDEWSDVIVRVLLQGFAESMSPGIMGFSFLSLVALLLAAGATRLAPADPAR
jgi:hypothetical protein